MINTGVLLVKRYQPWIIKVLITGAVIAALPVLGVLSTKVSSLLLIAAVAGSVIVPMIFFNLQVGPVIILVTATATEWYVSKGITPALVLTALLAAVWLGQRLVLKHSLGLVESPVIPPALCFILIAVISLPWGKVMADPLLVEWAGGSSFLLIQVAQLAVLVCSPVALIITAVLTTTRRQLKTLVIVYVGFTTVGIMAQFLRLPLQLNLRGLNSTWAVSLIYGQMLFNKKLPKWFRLAFIPIIAVWLYIKFYLGITWKSGWLPVVVSMGVITFIRSKKLLLLMLILLAVVVLASRGWWREVWTSEEAESGNRFDKWDFVLGHHSTRGHWFLGTGPFGYAQYFMTYFPDNSASTHSNYIDIFLQMGVVGCAAFAWLVGALAWVSYKLCTMCIKDQFIAGFVTSAAGGLVAVLVAMFLGDWVTPFVLNQGLHGFSWTVNSWIFLGALAAVPFILKNEQERKESREANS